MLLPRSSSSRGRGTKGYNEKAVTDIFNEMLSPADEDREVESFRRINRSHLSCGVGIFVGNRSFTASFLRAVSDIRGDHQFGIVYRYHRYVGKSHYGG